MKRISILLSVCILFASCSNNHNYICKVVNSTDSTLWSGKIPYQTGEDFKAGDSVIGVKYDMIILRVIN